MGYRQGEARECGAQKAVVITGSSRGERRGANDKEERKETHIEKRSDKINNYSEKKVKKKV